MAIYGAKYQDDLFTMQLRHIVRMSGLLMPVTVIPLGIGVFFHLFPRSNYVSDQVFLMISVPFVLVGLWQFFRPRVTTKALAISLGFYHVFVSLFLLFVTGLPSPIIACWLMLIISADIFFGIRGYIFSIVWLYGTATVDYFIHPSDDLPKGIEITFYLILMMITGLVVSRLRNINEGQHKALSHTRQQEVLQRDRLLTLINAMNDAVINVDEQGIVRLYNAAALGLLDTNKTLTGQHIDNLLKLYDSKKQRVLITREFKAGTSEVRTDLSHRFDDGESMNLSIGLSAVRPTYGTDATLGYILVIRDITKEKSLEEARNEFISVAGHELRTPIAVAEGNLSNLQFLLERGESAQTLTPIAAVAHEQVLHLAKLTNDLNTLSQAEGKAAEAGEYIDVNQLLESLYQTYAPEARNKQLAFSVAAQPGLGTVHANRFYLDQIMQNLITNAIKYTKQGSITLAAERIGDAAVRMSVRDTGIGISKTDQRHLFEKFYRSEDYRTRETSGTGLGLYIVQKLARKLGIQVTFQSQLNQGSTFSFVMPLVQQGKPVEVQSPPSQPLPSPPAPTSQ